MGDLITIVRQAGFMDAAWVDFYPGTPGTAMTSMSVTVKWAIGVPVIEILDEGKDALCTPYRDDLCYFYDQFPAKPRVLDIGSVRQQLALREAPHALREPILAYFREQARAARYKIIE